MKDYHFENDDKEFDTTIRLDHINEKVKELEQNQTDEDDLGDKDEFLKAFESEKFEDPLPVQPAGGACDIRHKRTRKTACL